MGEIQQGLLLFAVIISVASFIATISYQQRINETERYLDDNILRLETAIEALELRTNHFQQLKADNDTYYRTLNREGIK